MRRTRSLAALCAAAILLTIVLRTGLRLKSENSFRHNESSTDSQNLTTQHVPLDLLEEFLRIYSKNLTAANDSLLESTPLLDISAKVSTTEPPATTLGAVAPCPSVPIVAAEDGGRLGNKIWEYAAVWGLARLLGRPGYVPRSLLTALGKVFAELSLRPLEEIEHCRVRLSEPVSKWMLRPTEQISDNFRGRSILLKKWMLLPEPVLLFRRFLGNEFRYRPEILQQVRQTVQEVGGLEKVLVGVHVRRTDFAQFLPKFFNAQLVGKEFFLEAMDWYRHYVEGPLLFVIVSDDLEWCRENLLGRKDVVIASKSPVHDLALISSCNHTIIDYGTFGYWGALMAGGHTVSLNVDKLFNKLMEENKNWHSFEPKSKPKEKDLQV